MAVNNSIVQRNGGEPKTFSGFLGADKVKQSLANSLGNEKAAAKFSSSILSAVSTNPSLQDCDFPTIVSAGLLANALDLSLSPSLGFAYIVPFNDTKNQRKVATFILGYRGYIQLAIRSGFYKKIVVLPIKEGELVKYDPLNEDIEVKLIEDEHERENAKTVGYYAMFEYLTGFKKAIYWSKQKMLLHADRYSKAFSMDAVGGKYPKVSYADFEAGKYDKKDEWKYSSFWYKSFDDMAQKTLIRQLLSKWGIMSIELQKAYDTDTASMEKEEADGFMSFGKAQKEVENDFFGEDGKTTPPEEEKPKRRGRKPKAETETEKVDTEQAVDVDFFEDTVSEVDFFEGGEE